MHYQVDKIIIHVALNRRSETRSFFFVAVASKLEL